MPTDERTPAATTAGGEYLAGSQRSTLPAGADAAPPRRRPFCSATVYRRRRAQQHLDELLGRTYPTEPSRPGTFDLSPAELRRHADDLAACGWSVEEILCVLDLEPVTR